MIRKIFLIAFSFLWVGMLHATIINVPADYATIQTGIDSSVNGDTLLVQPGTYVENINYNGKNITIASLFLATQDTSYISQTVIDGDSLDTVVKFKNGEDSTAVLCGFSIANGYACNPNWPNQNGGGIICCNGSSPNLHDLKIHDNKADSYGGGICLLEGCVPKLINITISSNFASHGGGFYSGFSSPTLYNVAISNNIAYRVGGISCCENSSVYLNNVYITDNTTLTDSFYGGGVHSEYSYMNFKNCKIEDNYSEGHGGGASFDDDSIVELENVIIKNNIAGNRGGGLYFHDHVSTSLKNVTISNNIARYGGGIYFGSYCETILENVSITNNYAERWGAGIYSVLNSIDIQFSTTNRCNIYSNIIENNKGFGSEIFIERPFSSSTIEIIVDTFTVLNPTDYYASPIEKMTFDIQHCVQSNLVNSDLYVSESGDDSNGGLSADDPLKTIHYALSIIYADSENVNTIHLAPGTYSASTNGENFPILWSNYVNLSGEGIDETIIDADFSHCVLEFVGVSTAIIKDVTVTRGNCSYGGGIFCSFSSPTIKNVKICNSIGVLGGAVGCIDSNPTLINVIMTNNYASCGGGLCCYTGSYPILKNVTISNNICEEEGGGICLQWDSEAIITNSIVSENQGQYGIYGAGNSTEISYSNFYNNEYGNFSAGCNDSIGVNVTTNANGDSCDAFYNIQLDPLFVDSANNDYHLSWTNYPIPDSTKSPCIDAGDPNSPPDPDGTVADMGAYYYHQPVSINEPEDNSGCIIWNFPNPVINSTTIKYSLKKNSHISISIYNIKGQLISALVNEDKTKGEYFVEFDTEALSSGVYFYKIKTEDISEIKKIIVIK